MRTLLVIAALALSACVSAPPTKDQLATADYGPEPIKYEQIIKDAMKKRLKDPDSAKFEFTKPPHKTWQRVGMSETKYGWGVCGSLNAKNGFGGYTGAKSYFYLIKNDKLELIEDYPANVEKNCASQ